MPHLIQIDITNGEPLPDEDDDRPTEPIYAALVQTTDARDLRQVLVVGASQQTLVSVEKETIDF